MRKRRPGGEPAPTPGGPTDRPIGGGGTGNAYRVPDPSPLLAGYRVLRRLGSGSRADLYLGHAGLAHEADQAEGVGRPPVVALKVFAAEADPTSIEREIRALSQAPAGLLPELLDVATLPDGRVCLVLERLAGPSLGRHLGTVDRLEPGEAVTILAPVVTALSALQEAGLAHEALSPSSVLFDESGRPVLTELGGLRDLPPAGAARTTALRADYVRLGAFVRAVFDRLDPRDPTAPAAERLASWFDERVVEVPFRPCLDELERRLFGFAPATAVRQADAGAAATTARVPHPGLHRTGRAAIGREPVARDPRVDVTPAPPERRGLPGWFAVFHLPPELRTAVAGALAAAPAAGGNGRLRNRARTRPLLLAVLLVSALVLPVLGLLPDSGGADRAGADRAGSDRAGSDRAGSTAAGTGAEVPAVAARDSAVLQGDDPVLAVPVLLRLRAGCLAAASVVCLDAAEQPGSAIMVADGYGARSVQQGGRAADGPSFDGYTAGLVERTGNSALVALTPPDGPAGFERRPASALVVKGDGGWRLREIFDF